MSQTSLQRSDDFLKIADQFKLGALVTESSHPATAILSETAKRDIAAGLRELFTVDDDVVAKYREFVVSGRAPQMAAKVVQVLRNGGNIYFTGCGSTGRLSIQLASIWRDYWQCKGGAGAREFENRAFPVMAGGDFALIKAVEGFEDFTAFGKKQIGDLGVNAKDVVFAITEGGETSFVIGTAWKGVEVGAKVYFVYNNPDDILCQHVQRSREVIQDARIEKINLTTGPMGITGSTRMQATSIELAVMVTVLEMVVRELSGQGNAAAVPEQFLAEFTTLHATLKTPELLARLAKLVALEESVYRAGRKNNYFADRVGIDMLTDTTERSPTYCTPPFRKFDDTTATESWAFLFVPYPDSPSAWERVCKRTPRCVDWKADDVRGLVPEDRFARTVEIIGKIGYGELMRFRIGLDGLKNRPLGRGDSAVALVVDAEKESFFAPDGFQRAQLEAAVKAGANTGLIFVGSEQSCREMSEFVAQWNPACVAVLLTVPDSDLLLNGAMRVGLKLLLNTLSTCTMVRLGRVMGNTMIWVVPSNLKLIDRATRYIARLANKDYVAANRLLFEVIEYVEPRMKADQAYPPVVGVSVLRARHGLSNEEAEKRLKQEVG
ncbi:MAG: N-acetylmuramic acid 6-phosphate etherase [Verrucomicrobiota bacterium]|jgi:N-acetylmuramic acid 6-phosphate etherase